MPRVSYRASGRQKRSIPSSRVSFKPMKVWVLVILTMVTNGIYLPFWYMQHAELLNSLDSRTRLKPTIIKWMLGFYIVATLLSIVMTLFPMAATVSNNPSSLDTMGPFLIALAFGSLFISVLGLAATVYIVVLSFQVRKILNDHFYLELSGFWTFFLNLYYLQYWMNRLDFDLDVREHQHVFE